MKQRSYSDVKPNKFSIEKNDLENGKCTILFFDNIQEEQEENILEDGQVENKTRYNYDIYSVEVAYRKELQEQIENDFETWLNFAKEEAYKEAAKEVREIRNKLLEETDKEMCIDRLDIQLPENLTAANMLSGIKQFFEALSSIFNGKIAQYRQELRDITKQEGFPYNIIWPTKDKEE